MSDLSHKWENVPNDVAHLAGRAFTSYFVNSEVDPMCHPLRENNKFVISPGLLAGTLAPSSGRLSVGAKSPLTGGIKEANAGGLTATRLAKIGVKGVIIEGAPTDNDWYSILIGKDNCEILKTNDYAGIGLYDLIAKIWKKYDSKPGIIGSGIAGQRLLRNGGVFGNNIENTDPGRYAGRGGLGAVLGSKRIVAIISDDTGGTRPEAKDKDKFSNGRKALVEALNKHPVTGKLNDDEGKPFGGLKNYGTNILQNIRPSDRLREKGGACRPYPGLRRRWQ